MLTLVTYLNFIEAGLARSFLADHNIFCSLFDENAHLYGGAPFAMPVRLVVIDAQFQRAARILADAQRSIAENGNTTAAAWDEETISPLDEETLFQDGQQEVKERWEKIIPGRSLLSHTCFLCQAWVFYSKSDRLS